MNLKEATLEVAAAYREGQVKRKTNAVPTTRRFLLEAIGCHPKAEPIAYFEYEDLYTVLRHAREAIETGVVRSALLDRVGLILDTLREVATILRGAGNESM